MGAQRQALEVEPLERRGDRGNRQGLGVQPLAPEERTPVPTADLELVALVAQEPLGESLLEPGFGVRLFDLLDDFIEFLCKCCIDPGAEHVAHREVNRGTEGGEHRRQHGAVPEGEPQADVQSLHGASLKA
jgi:hypothetical protein